MCLLKTFDSLSGGKEKKEMWPVRVSWRGGMLQKDQKSERWNWPDSDRTLTLQCVLTGKVQEAYSAFGVADSVSYAKVKIAVTDLLIGPWGIPTTIYNFKKGW